MGRHGLRPIPHMENSIRAKALLCDAAGVSAQKSSRVFYCSKVKGLWQTWGFAPYPIRIAGCQSFSIIIARPTPKENRFAFLFSACLQFAAAKKGRALLFPPALPMLYASMMFATTPDPTVLPPSLIANRSPFSIAIGVISSISILMLSPGITISTPSGSLMTPVTSVVLK